MSYRKTYQITLSISEKIKLAGILAKTGKPVIGFLQNVQDVARSMCRNYDLNEDGMVPIRGDANELQVMMHVNSLSAVFGTAVTVLVAKGPTGIGFSAEICPKPGDLLMCRYWDENEAADLEAEVKALLKLAGFQRRLKITEGG